MTRKPLIGIIAILLMTMVIAFGQENRVITYQGYLTDAGGDPINGNVPEIIVCYYEFETGGSMIDCNSYFDVQITMGQFSVALDPGLENTNWPLWVEFTVNGETLAPRQQITQAAFSGIAQRINGDILTAPGTLHVVPPEPCNPEPCAEVIIVADSLNSIVELHPPDPVYPDPAIKLSAAEEEIGMTIQGPPGSSLAGGIVTMTIDGEEAMLSLQKIPEGQTTGPKAEMIVGSTGADINVAGPQGEIGVELSADDTGNAVKINWPNPIAGTSSAIELANVGNEGSRIWMNHPTADPPGPMIEINAHPTEGNSIILHSAEPLLCGSGIFRSTATTGAVLELNHVPRPHEHVSVIELSSAPEDFGHIKMFNGRIEPPPVYLEMNTAYDADQTGSNFIMYNSDPSNYGVPVVELSTNSVGDQSGASLVMFNPQPEPPGADPDPFFEVQTFETGASMVMFNPQPEPPGLADPFLEMQTTSDGGSMNFSNPGGQYMGVEPSPFYDGGALNMYHTVEGARPEYLAVAIEASSTGGRMNFYNDAGKYMGIDPEPFAQGGRLSMYNPQSADDPKPYIQMQTNENGGSYVMFNPQPEPPGADPDPFIEIQTDASGGSMVMFNPQPEPPGVVDPFLEMQTSSEGGEMRFYNQIGQYMGVDPTPFADGGVLNMYHTVEGGRPEYLAVAVEADADGGSVACYNDGTIYMGIDPQPFAEGGSIKMFDTGGGTTVEINSDGEVTARSGEFGTSNQNWGTDNFIVGTGNIMEGSYSQLFGMDVELVQDSTFCVNMPHILFGDDSNGYEFPRTDGYSGQVLMTNGAGRLLWEDMYIAANEGNKQLREIVQQLTAKVEQLERKVAELEREQD